MISEQRAIFNRIIHLERQNCESPCSKFSKQNNFLDSPFGVEQFPFKQSSSVFHKSKLKKNIFANAIINKNASKFLASDQANQNNPDYEEQQNYLQNEPFNELMITDFERKIYDQLDQIGVRFADPMELQNDYYQKVRSNIFSQDDLGSDRFLTYKGVQSENDLDTRDNSLTQISADLECIDTVKSADLKYTNSKILTKRSGFRRPSILEQYGKSRFYSYFCKNLQNAKFCKMQIFAKIGVKPKSKSSD